MRRPAGGVRNLFMFANYYGRDVYGATSYRVPGRSVFVFSLRGGVRVEL